MNDFLVISAMCCVISFVGSLQLGPVNYHVLMLSVDGSPRNAAMAALGGSLPEFLYGSCAVLCGMYLFQQPILRITIQCSTVFILAFMGVYYLLKQNHVNKQKEFKNNQNAFLIGFSLGLLNPQLIIFWFTVYSSLIAPKFSASNAVMATSVGLGATTGALILLILFAITGRFFKSQLQKILHHKLAYITIGVLFISLACYQFISLC